mgnify:CR=1 FL=1
MVLMTPMAERKQRLEDECEVIRTALEREEKLRKEQEALNNKLLSEKGNLLSDLEREKGELAGISERVAKLQAQKNDLDFQLQVSTFSYRYGALHLCKGRNPRGPLSQYKAIPR